MYYITKLATSQSQKPQSPQTPKCKEMYPVDERMWTIIIPHKQNIVARYLSEFTALYGPCEQINTFPSTHTSQSSLHI